METRELNPVQLRQSAAAKAEEARAILTRARDEKRSTTQSESTHYDSLVAQAKSMRSQADGLEKAEGFTGVEKVQGGSARGGGFYPTSGGTRDNQRATNPDEIRLYRQSESNTVRHDLPDGIRAEELSLGRWVRGLITGDWRNAEAERRAMATYDDTLGGYLVPSPISSRVIDLARNQSVLMRAGALTVPMETNTLTFAKVTQDPTGVWKAEGASHSASDVNLGAIVLDAHTLMASVKFSVEMADDAAPSVAQVIENSLSQSLALEMDRAGLFGSGANSEPLGIYNAAGLSEVDPNTTLGDYEDFVDAWVKCLEANGTPTVKMYSPAVAGVLAKLVQATELAPLPAPKVIEDLRTLISTQIPNNLGGGADRSVAFVGGFENIIWGVRGGLRIEVSREAGDSFEKGLVWIRAYMRGDFGLSHPAQIAKIINIDF